MSLDPGQCLVRVIIRLLDEPQLLTLALIEARLDAVGLLQPLQSEDQQLGVVLVGQGWEGDWGKASGLQPVHGGGVDGHCLLGGDVGAVLEKRY